MSERAYRLRADEITRLRNAKGLSIKKLADESDIHVKTLNRWLRGGPAYVENVLALARALDTSVQSLLNGYQPEQLSLAASSSAGQSLTFSVKVDEPATPEDVMLLCKLLAEAMEEYREIQAAKSMAVKVYFLSGTTNDGERHYIYMVASAKIHEYIVGEIQRGDIPEAAVIIEMGKGEPSREVKARIKEYYGIDHDEAKADPKNTVL